MVRKIPKHPCRPRTSPPVSTPPAGPIVLEDETSLVRFIAWQIFSRLPKHASVELADILQAGHLGLIRARNSYRTGSDVPFAVYARYRVRGEILDMLRRLDSAPRSLRRLQRAVEVQSRSLSARLQRMPTDEEIGASLGVETAEIRRNRHAVWSATMDSGKPSSREDDSRASNHDWTASAGSMPDAIQEKRESLRLLLDSITALPPRARQVVLLYYQRDFTMKQIGLVLQVNESRVSQIHKTALRTMSAVLQSNGISRAPVFG